MYTFIGIRRQRAEHVNSIQFNSSHAPADGWYNGLEVSKLCFPNWRPKSIPPPINIQVATSIVNQHISIVEYPKELLGAMPPTPTLGTYPNLHPAYQGPHQLVTLSLPNISSQSDALPHKPTAGPSLLINLANPL